MAAHLSNALFIAAHEHIHTSPDLTDKTVGYYSMIMSQALFLQSHEERKNIHQNWFVSKWYVAMYIHREGFRSYFGVGVLSIIVGETILAASGALYICILHRRPQRQDALPSLRGAMPLWDVNLNFSRV